MAKKSRPEVWGFPTTLYKEDPQSTPIIEWLEVGCARNETEWFVFQRRGTWDNDNNREQFEEPIFSGPFKAEHDAGVAVAERIQTLEREGWVYKFTSKIDARTGGLVEQRIP